MGAGERQVSGAGGRSIESPHARQDAPAPWGVDGRLAVGVAVVRCGSRSVRSKWSRKCRNGPKDHLTDDSEAVGHVNVGVTFPWERGRPQNARTSGIRVDAATVINTIATTFIQIPARTICGIVR